MLFLVATRTGGLVCCILRCLETVCMEMVVFLTVLMPVYASLNATSVDFKRGLCAMESVRQKQPVNT